MNNEIKDIPPLPDGVKEAINNKELAIFIGAGVSRFAGCDSWDTLVKNLVERCRKEDIFNYLEQVVLLKNNDKIKLITICNEALKGEDKSNIFMDEMKKALKDDFIDKLNKKSDELKIYADLKKMGNIFITTNADRYFDSFFDSTNIIYNLTGFINSSIAKGEEKERYKLYKIHGCISDENSLVFTMDRYIETYNNERFNNFIKNIFRQYTVLFVGYSLTELELLKNIKSDKQHFCLKDYFKCEDKILNFEEKYFKGLGIKLIPYYKDKHNYEQLKNTIQYWKEEILDKTLRISFSFNDIDEALKNPS